MGFVELTGRDDRPVYVNLSQVVEFAAEGALTRLTTTATTVDALHYVEVKQPPSAIYELAQRIRE